MSKSNLKKYRANVEAKNFMTIMSVLVVGVCALAIGFSLGRLIPDEATAKITPGDILESATAKNDFDEDLFWNTWDYMVNDYVDEEAVNKEEMTYGAIKGFVNSFEDPNTAFYTPEETKEFEEGQRGEAFSGIGAELGYNADGQVVVVSPFDGSPAREAGVKPNDIILGVDDEPMTQSDTVYDAVGRIRGEAGTIVKLNVLRPSSQDRLDIEITRGPITIDSMELEFEGDIAILDVGRFSEGSLDQWIAKWDVAVEQINNSGAKGLVIDLRGNPGGFLDAAVYAGSEFLEEGKVVVGEKDRKGAVRNKKVTREGNLLDIPVVVLINEGSASASEILSGALQQHDRAEIVGMSSYGKGSAQRVQKLSGGASLHITVLKWLLPDGSNLDRDNVITPDVEVELSDEDFETGKDPQLDKALEMLK